MKLCSLAILALCCAVAVSAAPASVNSKLGGAFEQIKERMQQFHCTSSIVAKALAVDGPKGQLALFKEIKSEVVEELFMCNLAGRVDKVLRCQLRVLMSFPDYVEVFLRELAKTNKKLVAEMREQIETKCMSKSKFDVLFAFEEEHETEKPEEFAIISKFNDIFKQMKEHLQQFHCTTSIVVKSLAGQGLKEQLAVFNEILESVGTDFVMCNLAGNFTEFAKCQLEVVKALPEYTEVFFNKLAETQKELVDQIRKQIETECKPTLA